MRLLTLTAALALATCSLGAQICPTVNFTSYGQSCGNAFPGATLTGTGSAVCGATLTLNAFSGCCNTFQTANVWTIGLQAAQVQIPGINAPCFLLNSAELILTTPPTMNSLVFALPPGLTATYYAQAAKVYFTTIGFTTDMSVTQGLRIDIQ